jgi:hypothetical protein
VAARSACPGLVHEPGAVVEQDFVTADDHEERHQSRNRKILPT